MLVPAALVYQAIGGSPSDIALSAGLSATAEIPTMLVAAAVARAIATYDGSVVVVSHDRRFLEAMGPTRASWNRSLSADRLEQNKTTQWERVFMTTAIVVTILFNAGLFFLDDLALGAGVTDEWWRTATTLFVYSQNGYEIAVLAAVFLFGWLLERRHGFWAPLLIFAVCGIGSLYMVDAIDPGYVALGGNGAALGAWLGALVIQLINSGIVILGIDQNYSQIIIGAVVILAVLLDQLNNWLGKRRLAARASNP